MQLNTLQKLFCGNSSQEQIKVAVGNILDLPNELKSELKSEQERNIADIILGSKPVYQVAKSYEEQLKTTGELLFVERDLDEMFRRSQPKEYEPADKYIEHIPPIDLLDNYKNIIKFRDESEKEKVKQVIKKAALEIIKYLNKNNDEQP